MVKGKNCRKCQGELSMCDIDIHPLCLKQEEAEKNPVKVPETEFDRALVRYPDTPPEDAA